MSEAAGKIMLLPCSGPTVCSPTGISWPAFPCVSISSAPQSKGIAWQMLHGGTDTLSQSSGSAPAPEAAQGCSIPSFGAVTQHTAQLPASMGRLQLLETSHAPDLILHTQTTPLGRTPTGNDPSGLGTRRRSLKTCRLCRADPVMDTGSSVYFKFYRGHFPLPGVGE